MIDVAVIREIAAPVPPRSPHPKSPPGWSQWIAQGLASATSAMPPLPSVVPAPATSAYPAAAATLRAALREVDDARAAADDWAVTVARHQVFLARRTLRTLLDTAVLAGPGNRLEWCLCGDDAMAA